MSACGPPLSRVSGDRRMAGRAEGTLGNGAGSIGPGDHPAAGGSSARPGSRGVSAAGTSIRRIEKHDRNPRVGNQAATLIQKVPRIGRAV